MHRARAHLGVVRQPQRIPGCSSTAGDAGWHPGTSGRWTRPRACRGRRRVRGQGGIRADGGARHANRAADTPRRAAPRCGAAVGAKRRPSAGARRSRDRSGLAAGTKGAGRGEPVAPHGRQRGGRIVDSVAASARPRMTQCRSGDDREPISYLGHVVAFGASRKATIIRMGTQYAKQMHKRLLFRPIRRPLRVCAKGLDKSARSRSVSIVTLGAVHC